MNATNSRVPCVTQKTFRFLGLTKLLLRYLYALAPEAGLDVRDMLGTSLQLTLNMRSRPHKDANNQGANFGTTVGSFCGGQLCLEDPAGEFVHELEETLPQVGKQGFK